MDTGRADEDMRDTTIDIRLLEEACGGNSQAFARLADAHYKMVYGVAFSAVGNWSAAQDIAQETFLLAWSRRESLRNVLAFPAWVRRIAANLAKNWIRSAQYRRRLAEHYRALTSPETDPHTAPDARLEEASRRAEVWQALEALSPTLREAIVLYYLHGETLRGVAESLGISENAAKKRIQHGRAKMRAHFEERWQSEMLQARQETSAHSVRDRFLASVVIGPAVPELGKSAASAGIGLWWEVTKQTALTQKALTGAAVVSTKKAGLIVVAGLLLAGGVYWSIKGDTKAPQKAVTPGNPKLIAANAESPATTGVAPAAAVTENREPEIVEASKPVIVPVEIADPKDYISLRGHVVNETGAPMAGVDVSVAALGLPQPPPDGDAAVMAAHVEAYKHYLARRGHYWNAVSDENGDFAIAGIRYAGATLITGRAPGYMAKMKYLRLDVTGIYPETIRLEMTPGVTIRGRLLSSDGKPVTDASVKLEGFVTASESQGGAIGLAVFTDAAGYFDLDVDEPGTMSLTADSEMYGVTSFSSVAADPGQELQLKYPPVTAVFGRVTDDRGAPVPNVEVRIDGAIATTMPGSGATSTSTGTTFSAMTASTGAYRIEPVDPAQRYGTSVYGKDGALLTKGKAIDDLRPGTDYELNLTVRPQMVVRGTVYGAQTGRPLGGILVVALPAEALSPSGRRAGSAYSFSATSASDGTYGITVSGDGGLYALTTTYSAGVWMGNLFGATKFPQVSLEPGESITQDLRVPEPVSRSFLVVDAAGAPIEGAEAGLHVRTENGGTGFSAGARSDADGHLTLLSIPPDCEVAVQFSKAGYVMATSVVQTGAPGVTFPEERIVLFAPAAFSAVLIGPDGQPLADQQVTVNGQFGEQGQLTERARTDTAGAFSIPSAFPATAVAFRFSVTASQDGAEVTLAGDTDTVTLSSENSTDLGEVRLSPAQ